jgi:putative ATPase
MVGQERWLGVGAPLRDTLEAGRPRSMVLWGPPGCGKTTLARALATRSDLRFVQISAVMEGIKELRAVLERAEATRRMEGRGTLLFVDEIHRWNKSQQDALLPHVESGDLILVGATTENPSFELNAALRSRLQVVRLDPLAPVDIRRLLDRSLTDPRGLADRGVCVEPDALEALARMAAGDARRALDDLERCIDTVPPGAHLTADRVVAALQRSDLRHDRSGDDHFDVVSALIKSLRGSDPDGAMYWLARMLAAGEDPSFITRRLMIFAAEDVGNADPRALQIAVAAGQAVDRIGMPEGRIPLAQAVAWLATCPKSNAAYLAIDRALEEVRASGALPVPLHLRNAPTAEMKAEGFGHGYLYPHDHPHRVVDQAHLPDALQGARYYQPSGQGEERLIVERMAWWRRKLAKD